MKPHLWRAHGLWLCYLPARPNRWCMALTPQDAYDELMRRWPRRAA